MGNEMDGQLRSLERAVAEISEASKQSLGFTAMRRYEGIDYEVGRRFVIADLSPLSFFHLVEHIEEEDVYLAIHRLHARLFPLLSCRHDWKELKRSSDEHMFNLGQFGFNKGLGPYICKLCTAYALGRELPLIGRGNLH